MNTQRSAVWLGVIGWLWFAWPAPAQTITIVNAGREPFRYSVRLAEGGPWSAKHELGANQRHQYTTAAPLLVSYWTDKPRFLTLQPNGTYRIDDPHTGELRPVVETLRPNIPDPGVVPASPPGRAASRADPARPATPSPAGGRLAVREVRVVAIADATCRKIFPDWQHRIREVVQFVSDYYETRFAIRLVLHELRAWDYKALRQDPEDRWQDVIRQPPGEADLTVAFVGLGAYYTEAPGKVFRTNCGGRAAFFGQHVMVSVDVGIHPNRDKTILIHELAHVFGAFHVADTDVVMQPAYEKVPTEDILQGRVDLGAAAREVLRLTREFDFGVGVASLSADVQRRLGELRRTAGHPAEQTQPDPVAAGYAYREERARLTRAVPDDAGRGRQQPPVAMPKSLRR